MQVAGSQLRSPPVKFRQERWLHIWRSISIQHVQMDAGLNSDPGNDSFWDKTVSCRSMQVKIASTDLWPQQMFTFLKMHALVESESSFGAYVCHRRPGGYRADWQILWIDVTAVHGFTCHCAVISLIFAKKRNYAMKHIIPLASLVNFPFSSIPLTPAWSSTVETNLANALLKCWLLGCIRKFCLINQCLHRQLAVIAKHAFRSVQGLPLLDPFQNEHFGFRFCVKEVGKPLSLLALVSFLYCVIWKSF